MISTPESVYGQSSYNKKARPPHQKATRLANQLRGFPSLSRGRFGFIKFYEWLFIIGTSYP